jgi:glycosyltransferase involved in cell wall biosynthesis
MNASLIICTYNRAESLARTLDSIKKMDVSPDLSWELVIVDNNSSDDTAKVVDAFRATTAVEVHYVVETKQGLSFARNRGIREKKGDIAIFTDDDVIVDKRWLTEIVRAFGQLDAACIGGKILPLWESPPPGWLRKELYSYIALLDSGDDVLRMDQPRLWGANFAVRSSIFEKYGGFNTGLGRLPNKLFGYEETELIDKLIRAGEKVFYCPGVVLQHCIEANRMKKAYFRKWKLNEGELMAFRRREAEQTRRWRVPLGSMKRLIKAGLRYVGFLIFKPQEAFVEQLDVLFEFGYLRETLRH